MGMLEALLSGAGFNAQLNSLDNMRGDVTGTISNLQTTLPQYSQFKPYTVTSGLANITGTDTGGYNLSLSPEQQALQNQMFAGASGLFGKAMGDTAGREADVYQRIRALQMPQEQEARLATENRMAAQGRLGLQSNQYGGSSPELVAQERALAEARDRAALAAISQAQAEQGQYADIANTMLTGGYRPIEAAMGMLQPAIQGSQISTQAGGTTADILGQLGLGGLTAQTNLAKIKSQLMGQGIGALSGALGDSPVGNSIDGMLTKALSGLGNGLGDLIKGLFLNYDNFYTPSGSGIVDGGREVTVSPTQDPNYYEGAA